LFDSSVHAEKQENSASDRQQNEVDKTCTFSDVENNNNNIEDKTLIPVEQQQLEPDQPVTPTTRKRICKLARKRRAHTMPDIMMAPRARTISEQSEEYDKVSCVNNYILMPGRASVEKCRMRPLGGGFN
jgi:hypothetical protein